MLHFYKLKDCFFAKIYDILIVTLVSWLVNYWNNRREEALLTPFCFKQLQHGHQAKLLIDCVAANCYKSEKEYL
jgi:hypothetical protein